MGFGKGRNGSWEACGGRGRDVSVLDMSSGSGCKEQQLAEEIYWYAEPERVSQVENLMFYNVQVVIYRAAKGKDHLVTGLI